jgi:hypothetical protein
LRPTGQTAELESQSFVRVEAVDASKPTGPVSVAYAGGKRRSASVASPFPNSQSMVCRCSQPGRRDAPVGEHRYAFRAPGDRGQRHSARARLVGLGFTVSQVVHDYGDICQAITEWAVEQNAPITTDEFHVLNRCLDTAIADAVTEHARITAASRSADELDLPEADRRRLEQLSGLGRPAILC